MFRSWVHLCLCGVLVFPASSVLAQGDCGGAALNAAERRVAEAYLAYYGRLPDMAGFEYWAQRLESEGGDLSAIIQAFGESSEFETRYGALDHETLIAVLYAQLFGREPDPAGLAYYTQALDSGRLSFQTITLNVLDGAHGADREIIDARLVAARHLIGEFRGGATQAIGADSLSLLAQIAAEEVSTLHRSCRSISRLVNRGEFVKRDGQSILADIYAYNASSPYKAAIEGCMGHVFEEAYCTLGQLAPIGVEHAVITPQHIMDRLLVSHDWMGRRFEAVLMTLPGEVRDLFGSVTAIVIDADIRPSYFSGDGAIYLDPQAFWLTPMEKATINVEEDYRAEFVSAFKFIEIVEYFTDGLPAWEYTSLLDDTAFTLTERLLEPVRLLVHELAHARDFLPAEAVAQQSRTLRIYEVMNALHAGRASTQLRARYPLHSDLLYEIAAGLYGGYRLSEEAYATTATDFGLAFEADSANDSYAYWSEAEDLAMLFEESMLQLVYGTDRYLFYTDARSVDNCDDLVVRWGARNRVAADHVKPRAAYVLRRLVSQAYADNSLDALDGYQLLAGGPLCETLYSDARNRWLHQGARATRTLRKQAHTESLPTLKHGRHHAREYRLDVFGLSGNTR